MAYGQNAHSCDPNSKTDNGKGDFITTFQYSKHDIQSNSSGKRNSKLAT